MQGSDDEVGVTMRGGGASGGGEVVGMMTIRGAPGSVLHRVGHQQSKWQKQVQEQRRNIYDKRTILN